MPDIEILHILSISCNTISTEGAEKDATNSTNRPVTHVAVSKQYYANTRPENSEPERGCTNTNNSNCYRNTGTNSNLYSSNTFTPMVNNNEIKYFLPGPNQEYDRRVSAEITR